ISAGASRPGRRPPGRQRRRTRRRGDGSACCLPVTNAMHTRFDLAGGEFLGARPPPAMASEGMVAPAASLGRAPNESASNTDGRTLRSNAVGKALEAGVPRATAPGDLHAGGDVTVYVAQRFARPRAHRVQSLKVLLGSVGMTNAWNFRITGQAQRRTDRHVVVEEPRLAVWFRLTER